MLNTLSDTIVKIETALAAMLAAAVTLLILLNIVSRALGMAIYWVDELAIYAMVWTTFLATSVVLKKRQVVAVTLLVDLLGERTRAWMQCFSDLMILVFSAGLLVLCWRWLDPATLASVDFDIKAFQGDTFNFVYSEKTNTLGIKKIWPWLILPFISISLSLHALNNLGTSLKKAIYFKGKAK
ncbi:TRAP transporter small permease [Marinobacterium sediminicola]|uniref:TRAP transporter small permease protein n=1 Tax=Marinobacterium sediminicola TaxID=518898 RepID=A0ABY1S3T6_9GAMM|nr:TRAP transporter small permease subunit [Marinobacterium sediminicola]ULG68270.1 TRAP transporter small permease subunit [Marinobacterium sediminicola]SMR77760.1 TRAP-type C4-dicarboxylate transport system, small permease component [Marinobacterium sediminicola]